MKRLVCSLFFLTASGFAEEVLVDPLLTKRYSGYTYDETRQVREDQLHALIRAASLAPSSYNEQPWFFIICNRATDPAAYEKALGALVEFNQEWAKRAPVLIISIALPRFEQTGGENRWAQYDTGAAAFSIALEAASLGLMAHQMGGFDLVQVRKAFAIPEECIPMAMIAVGYASVDEVPSHKKRKPLEENFFQGTWKKGVSYASN